MINFRDILEKAGDTAIFTFGRFNPPTTGHEKLIDALAKQQSKTSGSKMYVFPSQSQNPKKDPLPFALKVAYMRKMFPKYAKNIMANNKIRMVFDIAVELHNKGHRSIVMVVGSDRVTEFEGLLNKYNGVNGRHGYYGFDNIEVVSAGERDPDAEGVSGMSASKMRAAASDGDFDSFKTGVPSGFKDALKLYNDVRKNMGIREERDMGEMTDFESLRDLYLTGKLWNIGDVVESKGHTGKVINKGTNYLSFVSEDGKVHKTWLYDINERNYAQEYANYQGTPEQIARRSSRNKARRVMGDKAIKGMDVGHKDNNPMNNEPDNLRMEDPSENRREPRLRFKRDKDLPNLKIPSRPSKRISLKDLQRILDKEKKDKDKQNKATGDYRMSMMNDKDLEEVKQDPEIKDKEGTQPAKYYDADIAKSTKDKRAAHFNKKKEGPAPGDATAKTKPSTHTKKFNQMYGEARAKQAVSQGKVQKLVTAHGLKFKGKVYKEIDMELLKINNSTEMVTFNIIHPRELFGNETNISFKALKRGPFMATDTSKINEILGKDADMGDYIDDFQKSDAPQFKGKSKEKRKDMAIAAYLDKNESLLDKVNLLLSEDGHTDVASMKGKVQVAMKALQKMQSELGKLGDEDDLPTWWTNKVSTAVSRIDDMSDYLDTQVEDFIHYPGQVDSKQDKSDGWITGDPPQPIVFDGSDTKSILDKANKEVEKERGVKQKPFTESYQIDEALTMTVKGKGKEKYRLGYDQKFTMFGKGYISVGVAKQQVYVAKGPEGERVFSQKEFETLLKKGDIKMVDTGVINQEEMQMEFYQLDEKIEGLIAKAEKSGMPYGILKKVYDRGMAAWKTGHRPGTTAQQWAFARVNSFVTKSSGTWGKADADLAKQVRGEEVGMIPKKKTKGLKVLGTGGVFGEEACCDDCVNEENPCWSGFKQVGMKTKNGKQVPNCVPEETEVNEWGEITEKDDKSGKELNNPTRGDVKKYKVYVKNDKGNVVKVEFGDPNMSIKRDDPEARKNFRARHNCDQKKDKTTAGYWSCKFWSTKSVTDLMKG
jgi:hypothetical protein